MKVLLYTPSADGRVDAHYALALAATGAVLKDRGIDAQAFIHTQSLVVLARCIGFSALINQDFTDLVFIDSDIEWKPPDVLRLLGHDAPVCAANYRMKDADKESHVTKPWPLTVRDPKTGLGVADRAGTGFLRIRKDAALKIAARFPDLAFTHRGMKCVAAFLNIVENDEFLPEDYSFCRRWQACGGEVLIDDQIKLGHFGLHRFSA